MHCDDLSVWGAGMNQNSGIRTGDLWAHRGAASVLAVGFALLGLAPMPVRAADASAAEVPGIDTTALAYQTRRLTNDAGQFYMAWWLPQALSRAIIREMPNLQQADGERMLGALEPYLVFALSRGQVGEHGLVDVHDRGDLLRNSRLTLDGQLLTAAPADQNDAGAKAALETIKPALAAMLGRNGSGIEFALYQPMPGRHPVDPTMLGSLDYTLYRKQFQWQLPLWAPAAPLPVRAAATMPVAPVVVAPTAPAASPAATAAVPVRAPAAAPVPVQRRKVDPTTGEEFPERYDYNPYTGQKLVSQ
jgi:hypothetical protein